MEDSFSHSVACFTYESGSLEFEDFPRIDETVWILGKAYHLIRDRSELLADIKSRIWITYRKNFSAIGGTGPTSDNGWGCMLRCGQMILAQALLCKHLGREWRWESREHQNETYCKILKLFLDRKDSCYSIHQIAQMGVGEGKSIGQWFGPNTVAQVLRKLTLFDDWSSIAVHISMDNTIVVEDIRKLCRTPLFTECASPKAASASLENGGTTYWKPLVLFIPLRLGLTEINPLYLDVLKKCFTLKQSLGMIGGKPNHAHYFIGFYGKTLVYLDPHTTQPVVDINKWASIPDDTYHCKHPSRMNIMHLDPSIALGFFCHCESDFDDLCTSIKQLVMEGTHRPMFELTEDRPSHWPPFKPCSKLPDKDDIELSYNTMEDIEYDTDEEFELL